MQVDRETLHKIAHLARLDVNPNEEAALLQTLGNVLTWMEQLAEVDTTNIEPLIHMSDETNVFRNDVAHDALTTAQALQNAPAHNDTFFEVPKVLE